MKYLIIGAGGTGGAIGAYMAKAGKDVTFIARGAHLEAMRSGGLRVIRPEDEFTADTFKACTSAEYEKSGEVPDVIFLCVKGYSVDEMIPFMQRIAGPGTVIIPILNIYGTGGRIQSHFPDNLVTDGCMYIASEIAEPGVILMKGYILRVVFGLRRVDREAGAGTVSGATFGLCDYHILEEICDDLIDSGIEGILSDNIERDALLKFSYVSPQSACGTYYDVPTGPMQQPGEIRDCFIVLIREIEKLAGAMGIDFEENIVERNLKILDGITPDMTTSMQRDIKAGKASEIDGQIYEVVRLAAEYGVELPVYKKIASELKERFEE